jgi:hypothetical protein
LTFCRRNVHLNIRNLKTEPQVLPREVEALRGVDVASVSAGFEHVLALTYTGGVYSWGAADRTWIALGHGTASGDYTGPDDEPTQLPKRIEALRYVRVRCVSAGSIHSWAVTDKGYLYTWGSGRSDVLGHMEFENELLPKRVGYLYANGVVAVGAAAGADHTLVADADGDVWGFGFLNAIGVCTHDPTVKAMLEAGAGDFRWFGGTEYTETEQQGNLDCFNFLFPRGRASILMPVRIPVHVRGPVLQGTAL